MCGGSCAAVYAPSPMPAGAVSQIATIVPTHPRAARPSSVRPRVLTREGYVRRARSVEAASAIPSRPRLPIAWRERAKWRAPATPTARLPHMDSDALLRAAAANHRSWFRRNALAVGGRVERAGAVDLIVAGRVRRSPSRGRRGSRRRSSVSASCACGRRAAGRSRPTRPRHPPRRPRVRLGLAAALDGARPRPPGRPDPPPRGRGPPRPIPDDVPYGRRSRPAPDRPPRRAP